MAVSPEVAESLAAKLREFGRTLNAEEGAALVELLRGLQAYVSGHVSTTSMFSFSFSSTTTAGGEVSSSTVSQTFGGGDPEQCQLWITLPDGHRLCVLYGG